MHTPDDVAAVILAGGESQRMGTNKALLEVAGQPLIVRTVARVRGLCAETIVVTNTPDVYRFLVADFGARLVADAYPARGSLVGLYSGLRAARSSLALALACDMPLLNLDLLRAMIGLAADVDAVVPRIDGLAEPLHAIFRPATCAPAIWQHLEAGDRRMVSFLPDVQVRYLDAADVDVYDPHRLSFMNVNTPAEWADAQAWLAEAGGEHGPGL
jgi:molybdopterin-guanine dinucleotide biosynthesis protein A